MEGTHAKINIELPISNSVRTEAAVGSITSRYSEKDGPGRVLSSCTGSQEPIQKTQQCSTAKQRFVNKGVQWLFPLCTGTPGHNPGEGHSPDTRERRNRA